MDANNKGDWGGRDSAVKCAEKLAGKLGRTVHWALPPKGKDVREYLNLRPNGMTPEARGKHLRLSIDERKKPVEPEAARYRLETVNAVDFVNQKIKLEWAVTGLLVLGQPALVGGPLKALKTTIAIDLAISMATGMHFLGYRQFTVPKPLRVCLLSGESGAPTIQRTIKYQMDARYNTNANGKWRPKVLENLYVGFRLPQFSVPESLAATEELLAEGKFDVVFVDPLYLSLLAGNRKAQAGNMFDMGPIYMQVSELAQKYAVTPILLHHFPKGKGQARDRRSSGPADLSDLAFAGAGEFARQWVLISRRAAYDIETGTNKLWLSVGGSVGFSSCWAIDVVQGVMNSDFGGLKWDVTLRSQADQIALDKKEKSEKDARKQADKQEKSSSDWRRVREFLERLPDGATKKRIKKETGMSKERVNAAIESGLADGLLQEVKVRVRNGPTSTMLRDGYKLVPAPKGLGATGENPQEADESGGSGAEPNSSKPAEPTNVTSNDSQVPARDSPD